MMKFKGDGPCNRPHATLQFEPSSPQTGRSHAATVYTITLSELMTSDCGNRNAKCLGGPVVDESFHLGVFFGWTIGRFRVFGHPVQILCGVPQYPSTQLVRVPAQRGAHRIRVASLVDTTRAVFVSLPRRRVPNARAQSGLEQLTHAR